MKISEPHFQDYSLPELYDVLAHIDEDRFPDRRAAVLAEIDKRREDETLQLNSAERFNLWRFLGRHWQFWKFIPGIIRGIGKGFIRLFKKIGGWFSKTWKAMRQSRNKLRWVTGLLLLFVSVVTLGILANISEMNSKKEHKVYKDAVFFAVNSPQVQGVLGDSIAAGYWITGQVPEKSGGGGPGGRAGGPRRFGGPMMGGGPPPQASFTIPLSGPNGEATLLAAAEQVKGQWEFTQLRVEVAGDSLKVLDLINEQLPDSLMWIEPEEK